MIKSILLPALAFLVTFIVFYLFMAFINNEIKSAYWTKLDRQNVVIIGGLLSFGIGILVIAYRDINDSK